MCETGLKCGINNCPADQKRPLADCCYDPGEFSMKGTRLKKTLVQ